MDSVTWIIENADKLGTVAVLMMAVVVAAWVIRRLMGVVHAQSESINMAKDEQLVTTQTLGELRGDVRVLQTELTNEAKRREEHMQIEQRNREEHLASVRSIHADHTQQITGLLHDTLELVAQQNRE